MKSTKPWKVTINGEVMIAEAIKASTAVNYAMWQYLSIHRDKHALDRAIIQVEKVVEQKIEAKGTQVKLA